MSSWCYFNALAKQCSLLLLSLDPSSSVDSFELETKIRVVKAHAAASLCPNSIWSERWKCKSPVKRCLDADCEDEETESAYKTWRRPRGTSHLRFSSWINCFHGCDNSNYARDVLLSHQGALGKGSYLNHHNFTTVKWTNAPNAAPLLIYLSVLVCAGMHEFEHVCVCVYSL